MKSIIITMENIGRSIILFNYEGVLGELGFNHAHMEIILGFGG
jgi:hypothetical protein